MTSRNAFTRVLKGTAVIVNDQASINHATNTELADGIMTVIGCGHEQCDGCSHQRKTVLARGGQFMQVRASGVLETFGSGNTLTVTRLQQPGFDANMKKLGSEVCMKELCGTCHSIDFARLLLEQAAEISLFPSFVELIKSSESCPLCALISLSVVDPFSFVPAEGRPVRLRSNGTGNTVEALFPSKEEGYEELISERRATLHIYTDTDASVPHGIVGRLTQPPEDPKVARAWLAECLKNHDKCRSVKNLDSQPSRLVNVGPSDGSHDPRIEEGQQCRGDYLTLSYCWGDPSTVRKMTKESLSKFKERIPFGSLSQVFQDAIKFTRSLDVQYIWIDSLCIIQDSPEDQAAELPRMAEIYENALLNISAIVATSGDSSIFMPRERSNFVKIPQSIHPREDRVNLSSYITNQTLFDFPEDVTLGTLSTRGWCLQERLLSPRILHFGRDQLHWECHEGIWSESSTKRYWYDDFSSADDGALRMAIKSNLVFSKPAGGIQIGPLLQDMDEQLNEQWNKALADGKEVALVPTDNDKWKMYDIWYEAVSAYTNRQLTRPEDKLPALAGAAVRFNSFIKDSYVAGIWSGDLPKGLLWSRTAFEAVEVDPLVARRPGVGGWGEMSKSDSKGWRGAPSWSWASVDGPVHWVRDGRGPAHIGPYAMMTKPSGDEAYVGLEWGAVRVRGSLVEVEQLSWLRDEARNPEAQSDFEKSLAQLPVSSQPQVDLDDPEWERTLGAAGTRRPLYFLLICSIPLTAGQGQEQDGVQPHFFLGYTLMLRYWPADGAFRRVGIAKVALKDFLHVSPVDIHIL